MLTSLMLVAVTSCVLGDSLTGKTFYIYTNYKTWNEARTICEDDGRRLVQIDSEQTKDALKAFTSESLWNSERQSRFWIGLNKGPSGYRWDHCEPVTSSSYTFWDGGSPQASDRPCVFADRDTLKWKNEVCDSDAYQFLCEEATGPCTYAAFSGSCSGSNHDYTDNHSVSSASDCEALCNTELFQARACWMYSFTPPASCTLYFDTDPWTCSNPTAGGAGSVAKTRTCFTFQSETSTSSVNDGNSSPQINCNLYTTQAPTTTTTTTTTTPTTTTPTTTTTTTTTTTPTTATPTTTVPTTTTPTTTTTSTTTTTTPTITTTTTTIPTTTTTPTITTPTSTTPTTTTTTTTTNTATTTTTSTTSTPTTTKMNVDNCDNRRRPGSVNLRMVFEKAANDTTLSPSNPDVEELDSVTSGSCAKLCASRKTCVLYSISNTDTCRITSACRPEVVSETNSAILLLKYWG